MANFYIPLVASPPIGDNSGGGGSGGGVLVVTSTNSGDAYVCNKTAAEMYAACQTGLVVILMANGNPGGFYASPIVEFYSEDGYYGFITYIGDEFMSDSADAYPAWEPNN